MRAFGWRSPEAFPLNMDIPDGATLFMVFDGMAANRCEMA